MKYNNAIIAGVLVVLLAAAGGWYYLSGKSATPAAVAGASDTVATVNGDKILRSDLTATEAQITAQQGAATTTDAQAQLQSQALDSLISRKLLAQAAQQAGIVASSTEVAAQLQSDKAQFQDDASYQQALAAQGMTEADLEAQITANVVINDYLDQTLNLSSVTASDAEIQSTYDQLSAGQTNVPTLAQAHDQVEQVVIQQKQQILINAQVQKLRAAGNVQVLI